MAQIQTYGIILVISECKYINLSVVILYECCSVLHVSFHDNIVLRRSYSSSENIRILITALHTGLSKWSTKTCLVFCNCHRPKLQLHRNT